MRPSEGVAHLAATRPRSVTAWRLLRSPGRFRVGDGAGSPRSGPEPGSGGAVLSQEGLRIGPASLFAALDGHAAIVAQGCITKLPLDDRRQHRTVPIEKASQIHAASIALRAARGNPSPREARDLWRDRHAASSDRSPIAPFVRAAGEFALPLPRPEISAMTCRRLRLAFAKLSLDLRRTAGAGA